MSSNLHDLSDFPETGLQSPPNQAAAETIDHMRSERFCRCSKAGTRREGGVENVFAWHRQQHARRSRYAALACAFALTLLARSATSSTLVIVVVALLAAVLVG